MQDGRVLCWGGAGRALTVAAFITTLTLGSAMNRAARAAEPEGTGSPSIAVMKIVTPESFTAELNAAISAVLTEALAETRAFDVISDREVATLLNRERAESILQEAEPDFDRLARLGEKLDADYVVVGGVVHGGEDGRAHLQLLQVDPPAAVERVSRDYQGPPETTLDVLRVLVRLLVRDVLAERSGRLVIDTREEGATVSVNDVIVGSTPLSGPLELAEGLNTVELEREGFIQYRKDVEIVRDRTTELDVVLVPSREYVEAYRAGVLRQRWLGWGLIGLGALAAGGSVASFAVASARADDLNRDIAAYNASGNQRTSSEFEALRDRESDIATLDVLTIVGAAVAVASVGTGTGLLVANRPLDRYDAFVKPGSESKVRVDVGAGTLRFLWRF